jgi:hypothetical protein
MKCPVAGARHFGSWGPWLGRRARQAGRQHGRTRSRLLAAMAWFGFPTVSNFSCMVGTLDSCPDSFGNHSASLRSSSPTNLKTKHHTALPFHFILEQDIIGILTFTLLIPHPNFKLQLFLIMWIRAKELCDSSLMH